MIKNAKFKTIDAVERYTLNRQSEVLLGDATIIENLINKKIIKKTGVLCLI